MEDDYNRTDAVFKAIVAIALTFGVIWHCASIGYKNGYKQGQIDSFNSKIKYQLEKNKDGEMVYVEIEKIEKEEKGE